MVVANGRMASRYHIGFPVCARASWGMWGSYMAVTMRFVLSVTRRDPIDVSRNTGLLFVCVSFNYPTAPLNSTFSTDNMEWN